VRRWRALELPLTEEDAAEVTHRLNAFIEALAPLVELEGGPEATPRRSIRTALMHEATAPTHRQAESAAALERLAPMHVRYAIERPCS